VEKGELRFFVSLSFALHLAALLIFQLTGIGTGGTRRHGFAREPAEVSFVVRSSAPERLTPTLAEPPSAVGPSLGASSRGARGSASPHRGSAERELASTENPGRFMCMRNCRPLSPDLHPTVGDAPPPPLPGTEERRHLEGGGLKVVRYSDGGRLFSSTSGPVEGGPHLGMLGLAELAEGDVGGRPGHDACNPYRRLPGGARTLVLLVDTSASVGEEGTACAAGAALAALQLGFLVEVANFSTRTLHQPPTHDADAIYETLSTIQRRGTAMPGAQQLVSASARPRDFVAITDTAVGNYAGVLPEYQKAIASLRENRAYLYLIGTGVVCKHCVGKELPGERCSQCETATREPLDAFEKAGFDLEVTELSQLPP
jgi:hypothetical protein